MADLVATRVILDSPEVYIAHFTNISDGTGEAAVIKIDKSAIGVASDGAEAASLDIEKIQFCCDGMQVRILWGHTTDDLAVVLSGTGVLDFQGTPGLNPPVAKLRGIKDPRSAGGTGDILFTTSGHTAGDTYNVTLFCRKNPS